MELLKLLIDSLPAKGAAQALIFALALISAFGYNKLAEIDDKLNGFLNRLDTMSVRVDNGQHSIDDLQTVVRALMLQHRSGRDD